MDVSIIIISYNTRTMLRNCLTSVLGKTAGIEYEIFVVDNASSDGSCEMVVQEFPAVRLIKNSENQGFAKANNQAILMAGGEYVFLLNSDTVLENNAIGLMHDFMQEHPRAAVCGPLLLNADKTVQRSIDIHPMFFHRLVSNRARISWLVRDKYHPDVFPYSQSHRISDGWLTGAVLMIRRAVFPEVGFLDEAYHFYNEDADWGLAVSRSGWETWFVPEAVVTHLLGGSPKARSPEQEISFKLQCLRQNRYYFWKNSGGGRYGLFRVLAFCVYAVNLLRRVIMAAVSPPNKRASAIFKMRLGWKMFLATIEPEGKKAN